MNWFLVSLFTILALAMVLPAIWRKDYRLQFPCLAGLTVLYQVALPLASLNTQTEEASPESIARFAVMSILCLAASWAGYVWLRPRNLNTFPQFDSKKLGIGAVVLAGFGAFFAWKLRNITPDVDPETGNWTGIATIYTTLAGVMRYGAILAAILFFRTRNWKFLLLVLPQLWNYFVLFTIGRRSPTGELMVVTCTLFFLYRKWSLPLWLMALGTFAMAVFCFNIGTIRATVDESLRERVEALKQSDPLHSLSLQGMAEERRFVEVYNATKFMEAKAIGGHYTFGLHFWNQLVFGYVPAQIFGREFKDGLMIKLTDDTIQTGFEKGTGTCETGIGEAFMAFGYFGWILFFALGGFMRWVWEGAVRNSVLHQLLLMVCTLPAVMTFASQMWAFLNLLVSILVFVGPWAWWSHAPRRRRAKPRRRLKPVAQT